MFHYTTFLRKKLKNSENPFWVLSEKRAFFRGLLFLLRGPRADIIYGNGKQERERPAVARRQIRKGGRIMLKQTEQEQRIRDMEEMLTDSRQALDALEESLDAYKRIRGKIRRLEEYYGSEDWYRDREDDAAGKLSGELRRGVLSEDLIYDVLTDERRLAGEMAAAAAGYLRD